MLRKVFYFMMFCFLSFNINVFADELETVESVEEINYEEYFKDEGLIFDEEQKIELLESIKTFHQRTNFFVYIHTVENLKDDTIDSLANYNYSTMFPNNDVIYILMSKEEGDIIIKYGDINSEIITNELISVMMMSVDVDFKNGNIVEGLKAALFNGMVLIEENLRVNEDTHEVFEKDETQGFHYILICIGSAVIFIVNCFFLISFKKEKKDA